MGERSVQSSTSSLAIGDQVGCPRSKVISLSILLLAQVAAMGVWFSSSAAIADIKRHYTITSSDEALLTSVVQIGFVVGTTVSAILSLPDRHDPRRLFAVSALVAAIATGCLAFLPPTGTLVVVLRFTTGVCMAGVYPVGMRLAVTWANRDLGLLVGLLVGALTLGSASPHLLAATGDIRWQTIYGAASAFAVFAAVLIAFAGLGPNIKRATSIDLAKIAQCWRCRPIRMANIGYLGHMWELYAMWAWLSLFLHESFAARGLVHADTKAAWLTFAAVAAGSLGAWMGGFLADRIGRTSITIAAMAVSAACATLMGWLFNAPLITLIPVTLVWGISVIADSAQFSAAIAELAEPSSVGTILTAQTCAGFLLTLVSIHLVPEVQATFGWPGALTMLALGPAIGCVAMWRLRLDPESIRLAGGKR